MSGMAERETLFASLREWHEMTRSALPPVKCIMSSHAVPYGRIYRQWNTKGELIVWANRGEIADLTIRSAFSDLWNPILSPALVGIPVVQS